MKVLLLTIPYCGGLEVGQGIATDCGYNFIQDPFEIRPLTYTDDKGDDFTVERQYSYGDVVPDNTLMLQYVGWHLQNPQNLESTPFLNGLKSKFNKVVCLMSRNVEFNWKLHCSSQFEDDNDNYWYKKWNRQNCFEYTDDKFNQSHKNKIVSAHNTLVEYKDTYNLPVIWREDIFPVSNQFGDDEINNINRNPQKLNEMFAALDIGMPVLDLQNPESMFYQCLRNTWENKY